MINFTLRRVTASDRAAVLAVEKRSTPTLQYLPQVFDQFLADSRGEFTVCELDGEIVACAKFTVLPDGSAWLETIRVVPERQGLGIGKRFYENYFDIARRENVARLCMYTGIGNAVSKGLAERYGFRLAETFDSLSLPTAATSLTDSEPFEQVMDSDTAVQLIMPHAATWGGYLVMNRTFYRLTAVLCNAMARQGAVYASGEDVLVLGARFMPERALHLGFFAGDATRCLGFAAKQAQLSGVPQISCLFSTAVQPTKDALLAHGYQLGRSKFIVLCVGNGES